mgnify:CR=1 FL=1
MSLKDYQKQVDDWAQQYKLPYWSPLSQMVKLSEEVGELGRAYNHKYGDKPKKPTEEPDDIAGEMADIIFDVMCMANYEGIDLDKAFEAMFNKINTRDKDRFEKKAA